MRNFIFISVVLNSLICFNLCCDGNIDPDEDRDAVAIIESRGFKAEVHYVVTDDGYILALHRIINPLSSEPKSQSKPILLQHGLLGSSADFLINTPQLSSYDNQIYNDIEINAEVGNNLGFVLSSNGWDVFLSNSRGNTYSTNHTKLKTNDKKFWKFTFDEMSKYDLTANIKYIMKITNQTSIGYIGHSQGTAIMFALLSSQPEYTQFIDPFIALAPVAYVGKIISPIRYFAQFSDVLRLIGGRFLPSDKLIKYLADEFCDKDLKFICSNLLFLFAGFDEKQLNMSRLGVYFTHTPAGTSSWNIAHFGQLVESKRFRRFDYGEFENEMIYGQKTPPEYNLDAIKSDKIALISSNNDWLADVNDVDLLRKQLKVPLLDDYLVPDKEWSHLDFIFGKNAGKYVYSRVLDILNSRL